MKRILSILLALSLLLSITGSVFASSGGANDGTQTSADGAAEETAEPTEGESSTEESDLPEAAEAPEEAEIPVEDSILPTDTEAPPEMPSEESTEEGGDPMEESSEPAEDTVELTEPSDTPVEPEEKEEMPEEVTAQAGGAPIVKGTGLQFVGTLSFTYWRYIGVDAPTQVTCYLQADSIKTLNGTVVYCLDPALNSDGKNYTQSEANNTWGKLPYSLQDAIGLTLAYGYPNISYPASGSNYSSAQEYINAQNYIATQLIIWEFLAGIRSTSTFALTGSTSLRNACDVGWGTVRGTYDAIVAKLQAHNSIPKYASRTEWGAPEYELLYNSSTGTYRYELPAEKQDTWHQYRFDLPNGVSFIKAADGQTIIGFEATAVGALALQTGLTLEAVNEGGFQDISNAGNMCWECNGSQPVCIAPRADPLRAFLALKADVTGSMTARKTSPSGDVEGYCFKIYHWGDSRTWYGKSDAAGALYLTDKEYNQSGNRVYAFNGLIDGDYTFLEQLSVFGAGSVFPASWRVTVTDAAGAVTFDRTFTKADFTTDGNGDCRLKVEGITGLTGGGSMEMVITNAPLTRPVSVMKIDENGEPVVGARLQVLDGRDVVDDWVSDGRAHEISGGLLIGKSYTLHEVEAPEGYRKAEDVTFTVQDTDETQKIVMVDPRIGRITVQKTDTNDEPLAGATFLLEYSTNGGTTWTPVRPATGAENGVGTCSTVGQDGTITTGEDGMAVFAELTVSGVLYRLTETHAPAGFQLLAEPVYTGAIEANTEQPCELYFQVVNVHLLQMPPAGGDGSVRLIGAIAAALTSASLLGLLLLFKRRKPPESV